MTRILVLGGNGMLGSAVLRYLSRTNDYKLAASVNLSAEKNHLNLYKLERIFCESDALNPYGLKLIPSYK